ncbi:hypothetical protein [Bradyrhizobium sp. SYSU BS000235]|uniref:hypothetical protein n=1 Tax=Bradyrhizobium sp. SYSU BS000235 TaxID=3411332 RepID=UPI003C71C2AE
MPFGVSDLLVAVIVVGFLVAVGWVIATALDRRSDVLHYVDRENNEPEPPPERAPPV